MKYTLLSRQTSVALFLCCAVAMIVVAFLIAVVGDDRTEYQANSDLALVKQRVRSRAFGALGVAVLSARRMEGFVVSRFDRMPNISAPGVERLVGQEFPGLEALASELLHPSNPVSILYSFPGGVQGQSFPEGASPSRGQDLFLNTALRASIFWSLESGLVLVESPRIILGNLAIVIRLPIYNSSIAYNIDTWWGNVVAVVQVSKMIGLMMLRDGTLAGPTWRVRVEILNGTSLPVLVIDEQSPNATVLSGRPPDVSDTVKLSQNSTWVFHYWHATPPTYWLQDGYLIMTLVLLPIGLAFIATAWANVVYAYATRQYSGTSHAPKQCPFAITTIGIVNGAELWSLQPEALLLAEETLRKRVLRVGEAHRVYVTRIMSPHSFSVVSRSIDAAVHVSFSIQENLAEFPIEIPLDAHITPEQGNRKHQLQLVCTVHWCKDVHVACEVEEKAYVYEGRSMLYAAKLYSCAIGQSAGGETWLSKDAWAVAEGMRGISGAFLAEFRFKQSPVPQDVFTVTDPHSELLRRARKNALAIAERFRVFLAEGIERRSGGGDTTSQQTNERADNRWKEGTGESHHHFIAAQHTRSSSDSDKISDSVMRNPYLFPNVTDSQYAVLAQIFEPLADTYAEVEFSDIVYVFVHYYNAFVTLLKPLAVAERDNILRKLSVLFALPPRQLLSHIAVVSALQNLGTARRQAHVKRIIEDQFNPIPRPESPSTPKRHQSPVDRERGDFSVRTNTPSYDSGSAAVVVGDATLQCNTTTW